jgi:proliferating cell nuclear antigen PCNA
METLNITFHEPNVFKTLIEVLKDLIPETNVKFITEIDKKTGAKVKVMRINAVDTSQTVLINLKILGEEFWKFEFSKKELLLGIDLKNFHKFIKSVEKEDILKLAMNNDDINCLSIITESMNSNRRQDDRMKLIDLSEDEIMIPELSCEAVITMDSTEFHKICKDMIGCSGENIEIICLMNQVELKMAADIGDRKWTFWTNGNQDKTKKKIGIKMAKNAPSTVQGIFKLKHITTFTKCTGLSARLQLHLGNNTPLIIKYEVGSIGRLLIAIAPACSDIDEEDYSNEEKLY